MQDKQKVTLYIQPELHRKLKIRAAVDSEPMSSIAERAILFYLENPEVVDDLNSKYGQTHRVYTCPECTSSVVIREGELVSIKNQPSVLADQNIPVKQTPELEKSEAQPGEQELVPC
ncbi:hypothetical protein AFK68_19515 [Hydrocoleum sp. CS-953]|uniref:hypothetical protein n=1 Tax=Hydrocoleum sp. CS-953 TaxID=1671698 RepID=UPI000B9B947A|nr:hypothetical protein [Hydrocoleum sp. CS-953]OZH53162.1 hypothetical protein AFK68_19515 [Hydrocoleum sp. CS-953]